MHAQQPNKTQGRWAKLLILLVLVLVSCKPTVPSDYIQPGDMEDLLYDYHIAMSMAAIKNATPTEQEAYKLAVFKRHDVSESEFSKSLQYYMRHTERLKKMYENIDERLQKEARAQGASASDFSQYGEASLKGDTTNVWNKARAVILMPQSPDNYRYFEIQTDTTYHKGDQLTLEFDPQFIVQDGTREGVAVFSVTFGNDSVATETIRIYNEDHQVLSIRDNAHVGIKRVRGYFYMPQPQEASSTFRLLAVTNIKLIRMHKSKTAATEASDSTDTTYPIRNVGGEAVEKLQVEPASGTDQPVMLERSTPKEALSEKNLQIPVTR